MAVTPISEGSRIALFIAVLTVARHSFSGLPHETEITDGWLTVSCAALVIAVPNPGSVFGAKYTTIFAFGATAPATSMSSLYH